MTMGRLADFAEVWLVDFKFSQPPGERPQPLCLVARELHSNCLVRLWQDDLRQHTRAPFDVGSRTLFVAYLASEEVGCFLELGWPLPRNVLDLYGEFRLLTSGLQPPCGHGLLGVLAYFGLSGGVAPSTKDAMRHLAQRGGLYTSEERAALLDYCQTEVDALGPLLLAMLGRIESPETLAPADRAKTFGQALQRGEYLIAVAAMERRGVPIDVPSLTLLRDRWKDIERDLITQVDGAFGVYAGKHFQVRAFEDYLRRHAISWPRTANGRPHLDRDTFKGMVVAYPALAPLHELRSTLDQMRNWKLPVGRDGRNRCLLSPFGAKTGRNTPSTSQFVFGLASWLRGLVRPEEGMALAHLDWEQQEFGIAAALSGDGNMMAAYRSGDPYLTFAVQAGAAPAGATRGSHGAVREQFKICALGIQYGMGADTLAGRLGASLACGRDLIQQHRRTYPGYWRWSEGCVSYAMLHRYLTAAFGWRVHVDGETRPTTLRNFLLQANGAEMLRLACILAAERGLPVCCPVHDALLVEAPTREIDDVVFRTAEVMRQASELVLSGFPLRTDATVIRAPQRYADKRGQRMWKMVWPLVGAVGNRRSISTS
jgi:hypothetical protein